MRERLGKGIVDSSLYGDLGTQYQSHIPNENNHVMNESKRNQNKVLDNTSHRNSQMKTKRDHEFPFHQSGYQSHNESSRPPNGMRDDNSSFLSHDSRQDTDQEKMKLLRMIYKLQDQLNKTRYRREHTKTNSGNLQSVSHVNFYQYSPTKPISYYDDYELFVSRNFSSEVELDFLTQQFHPLNGGEYVNPNVSLNSMFKANIVASRYFTAIAAPTDTDESIEFFSYMSETRKLSAKKEVKSPQKSTNHKLMGYSTLSQVTRPDLSRNKSPIHTFFKRKKQLIS